MGTNIKLPYHPNNLSYHPHNLSYYTTWWLTSTSSTSSSNTASFSTDDRFLIENDRKKQKVGQNRLKLMCCIPSKIFRIKF